MKGEVFNIRFRFVWIIFIFFIIIFSLLINNVYASASEDFNDHFRKISHYAEEYEIGNLNYAQLMTYIYSERQDMEDFVGQKNFSSQRAKEALGEPTSSSKYIYSKKEGDVIKTENKNYIWEKIIYDGKKIKIHFKLEPFLYYDEENKKEVIMPGLGLYYELKRNIDTKELLDKLNINENVDEIKTLAVDYSQEKKESKGNVLYDKIREFENAIGPYFEQQSDKCNDIMQNIFEDGNKKSEEILHKETLLYEGDKFDVISQIEICQSCTDEPWMSIYIFKKSYGGGYNWEDFNKNDGKDYSETDFKNEITSEVNELSLAENDEKASEIVNNLNDMQKKWEESVNIMAKNYAEENMEKYRENVTNDELNDEKKIWEEYFNEYRKKSFEERKNFYLDLYSKNIQNEYTFTRTEYTKILAEHSLKPEECSNGIDDNGNGKIDCGEKMCQGNVCGEEEGNKKFCQNYECVKSQEYTENIESKDCKKYDSIPCEGTVIFKGEDMNGCPLEPICIGKNSQCKSDSDCFSRCGKNTCVEGICKMGDLAECKEAECNEGENKKVNCESGDGLVVAICEYGEWVSTGQECSVSENQDEIKTNNECNSKSDCSEEEVCSNGKCIYLPESSKDDSESESQIIEYAPNEDTSQDENDVAEQESTLSGNAIKILKSITGYIINGFAIEDEKIDEKKENGEKNFENQEEGQVVLRAECRETNEGSKSSLKVDSWGYFSNIKGEDIGEDSKDMCNGQYQNDVFERKELEKSFNENYAKWFFEDYLASSVEDLNRKSRAMDDLYWKDINLALRIASMKDCKNYDKDSFNLINFSYETKYGSIKFYELFKNADIGGKEVEIISPYMGFWVYPSREVIEYQMKNMMTEERFNEWDDSDGKVIDQSGINAIKSNENIMNDLGEFIDKYGKEGKTNIKIVFKDKENNKDMLAFFVQLNRDDIMIVKPMLPEKIVGEDINAEVDFNKFLDMMESVQKDSKEFEVRKPEWDNKESPSTILAKTKMAIKVFFNMRSFVSSVDVTPKSARGDAISLATRVFYDMMVKQQSKNENSLEYVKDGNKSENENSIDKSDMTGNVVIIR